MYGLVDEEMGFRIIKIWRAFRRSIPFWNIFWKESMSVNARVILLVGYNKTMYTRINEKIDSHITEIWRAFRRSVPFFFLNFLGNRRRLMWGSYFWLGTTRLYTQWLQSYQQKDRLSHLIQNSTSLSAFGSIFENFWGTDIGWCEGRTFGWVRQDYVHAYQRKDRLSHH